MTFFYSSDGHTILVSEKVAEPISTRTQESSLDRVLAGYTKARGVESYGFNVFNGLKCPKCEGVIYSRDSNWSTDTPYFIDGMLYVNDTDEFRVTVSVSE